MFLRLAILLVICSFITKMTAKPAYPNKEIYIPVRGNGEHLEIPSPIGVEYKDPLAGGIPGSLGLNSLLGASGDVTADNRYYYDQADIGYTPNIMNGGDVTADNRYYYGQADIGYTPNIMKGAEAMVNNNKDDNDDDKDDSDDNKDDSDDEKNDDSDSGSDGDSDSDSDSDDED